MSQKRKAQRARHAAEEEAKGKNVVKWIFAVLIVLAAIFLAYSCYVVS